MKSDGYSKLDWLGGSGIEVDWPTAELPETIHVDNVKEFRSKAMRRALKGMGFPCSTGRSVRHYLGRKEAHPYTKHQKTAA